MNLVLISRIHNECTVIFANSLSINFQLTFLLRNSQWIHYLFHEFTTNSILFPPIYFYYRIFIANLLSIHYEFREFTLNSLFCLRINFEFTICFANSFRIHYIFREFKWSSQPNSSPSREPTLNFYLLRELTVFSRIHLQFTIHIAN